MRLRSILLLLLTGGCFPSGEGIAPRTTQLYFPVGLALDETATHLFIVSSDFDLQFNAGSVQSWDLVALREKVDRILDGECFNAKGKPLEPQTSASQVLYPGRCYPIRHYLAQDEPDDPNNAVPNIPILVDTVEIGAFATDVIHRARPASAPPGEPGRLFIPVRGDATLHWIDVTADGDFLCGQTSQPGACDGTHRSGDDPAAENTRGLRMLPEPYGVAADERAEVVMVTNQTAGAAGLFLNDWTTGPKYEFTLSGLADRPIGVTSLPEPWAVPALGLPHLPAFLIGYRNAAWVSLVRVYFDDGADPPRPYAKVPSRASVLTNSSGIDSRGLDVDASVRRTEERRCAQRFGLDEAQATDPASAQAAGPDYAECVKTASAVPLDTFVTNRSPASLVVGQSRPAIADVASNDLPIFETTVVLSRGPTRVVVGDVVNVDGERERRAFAVSFDSRRLTIYDPARQRIEAEITTGRGPQAFAVDPEHGLGYVAHFTDSYIGVVDLDQRHPDTYATIVASFGEPLPPRASK